VIGSAEMCCGFTRTKKIILGIFSQILNDLQATMLLKINPDTPTPANMTPLIKPHLSGIHSQQWYTGAK